MDKKLRRLLIQYGSVRYHSQMNWYTFVGNDDCIVVDGCDFTKGVCIEDNEIEYKQTDEYLFIDWGMYESYRSVKIFKSINDLNKHIRRKCEISS